MHSMPGNGTYKFYDLSETMKFELADVIYSPKLPYIYNEFPAIMSLQYYALLFRTAFPTPYNGLP